ncbi:hypothetical protein RhiJN_18283 [Ceratobasidium sp. AG-Ba]|nr:hypothetical protein RhiJN_18283 [Ceratobasidium sp. AG-Ba]
MPVRLWTTVDTGDRSCITGNEQVQEARVEPSYPLRSPVPTERSRNAAYDNPEPARNASPPRETINTGLVSSDNLRDSGDYYNSVGDDSGYASTGSDDYDTEDTSKLLPRYIRETVPSETHSFSSYVPVDPWVESRPRSPSPSSCPRGSRYAPREPPSPAFRRPAPSKPDPVVSALTLSSFDPGQCQALLDGGQCGFKVGTGEVFCRTCHRNEYDGPGSTALLLTVIGNKQAARHESPTSAVLYIKGPFNPDKCHAPTKKGLQCKNNPAKNEKLCKRWHLEKYPRPDPQQTERPLPKRSFSLLELLKPKAKNVPEENDLLRELLCNLSPAVQRDIRAVLKKPISKSDKAGIIYGFGIKEPTDPSFVYIKVGRSEEPDGRVKTWVSKCRNKCRKEVYHLDGYTKTKHYKRLERLVHLALEDIAEFSLHLHPIDSRQAPAIVEQTIGRRCTSA